MSANKSPASSATERFANSTLSVSRRPPQSQSQAPNQNQIPVLNEFVENDEEQGEEKQEYQEEEVIDYEGTYDDDQQNQSYNPDNEYQGEEYYEENNVIVADDDASHHKLVDPELPLVDDDPRDHGKRIKTRGKGRNTESFDPTSTLVRPEMRIIVGPNSDVYGSMLKHDDVVIVPDFFCHRDDWAIYYKLIEEMRDGQSRGEKEAEWISWHEGAHLITKNPDVSPTYLEIQQRICTYFNIPMQSIGTRFNWYRDSSDWKPFHHDSAAYNPQRAQTQNMTVGVSFGSTRELAFLNVKNGTKLYFPQVFSILNSVPSIT